MFNYGGSVMNSTVPADLLELNTRFETWRANQTPSAAPVTKPNLGTQISRFLLALTPLGLPPEALTFLFDHAFLQFLKQWRRRPERLSDRNRPRLPAIDPPVGA
jgi:hypothetical protein